MLYQLSYTPIWIYRSRQIGARMEGPIWKGIRSQRICSFRGAFANRGSGMELAVSDVVDRQGLEPRTDRL